MLRGWGRRFGVDPLAFIPTIDSDNVPAPWYTEEWKEKYSGLSEIDRVIRSVCTLQKISSQGYDLLKESQKNQVLIINYEEFFSKPSLIIKKLSNFLNTHPFSNMEEVCKREGCPKEIPLSSRMSKFKELSRQASPNIIRELKKASEEYEFQWDLEPST